MRLRLKLTLALLTILQFVPLFAQGQASKPAFLADVTSSVMKASATGRSYQISVALPDGYSKQHAPYPVLYAADANPEFGTVVETARVFAEIPGLVIVGIGYPNSGQGFAWVPRALDLTTTPDPKAPGTNGGAAEFLQFIRNDLVPYVERTYNVKQDRAWFGHSFGGLFGIYICSTPVALTDPGFINPQNRRRRLSGQITNSFDRTNHILTTQSPRPLAFFHQIN
jgi:predicted alpha/beta superfamily hydrolase